MISFLNPQNEDNVDVLVYVVVAVLFCFCFYLYFIFFLQKIAIVLTILIKTLCHFSSLSISHFSSFLHRPLQPSNDKLVSIMKGSLGELISLNHVI